MPGSFMRESPDLDALWSIASTKRSSAMPWPATTPRASERTSTTAAATMLVAIFRMVARPISPTGRIVFALGQAPSDTLEDTAGAADIIDQLACFRREFAAGEWRVEKGCVEATSFAAASGGESETVEELITVWLPQGGLQRRHHRRNAASSITKS